jgi:Ca-activated chloride channel family protein
MTYLKLIRSLPALTLLIGASTALANPALEDLGGQVQAELGGETVYFPSLKTDIDADISGDLATVTVRQVFANPLDRPVHATYLFPLNRDAAVYEMSLAVGKEIVRAKIDRIEAARKTFEEAKLQGRSAALLEQHRPNMFTQSVANLVPGYPITVTLRYVQTVTKVDGDYELVLPLVVGPRYQPPGTGLPPGPAGASDMGDELGSEERGAAPSTEMPFGKWEIEALPAYPPTHGVDLPEDIDPERVAIRVHLDAGMPIQSVLSRTHAILVDAISDSVSEIRLSEERVIDNRDFVLKYRLAGEGIQAAILAHHDERGGFFSLLIEPPRVPDEAQVTPREMVFVLDCSGSMNGLPMEANKAFMREALSQLRPGDTFRIIRFSDAATEFSTRPLAATPKNIRAGIRYTNKLRGSGGTHMSSGIRQALDVPTPPGTLRIVTFLTDGYIGNEATVLSLIRRKLGDARLYAFGVGTSVNRYLLSEMGTVGRGFTRYMDPTEDVEEVAAELAARLKSPVLTDIEIDWGELAPSEVHPLAIPDLFAGQSLRVQGRYTRSGEHIVRVKGLVNGRKAELPLRITLPDEDTDRDAIALVWAKTAIKDAMRELATDNAIDGGAVKERVTKLGLDFSLVTRWTAFVAVSEQVYNPEPGDTETLPVPLNKVKGVSPLAYGPSDASASTPAFVGHGTPEPSAWAAMFVVAALLGLVLWRRRTVAGATQDMLVASN